MIYPSFFKSPDGREVVAFTGDDTVVSIKISENVRTGLREICVVQNRWEHSMRGRIMLSHTAISRNEFLNHGLSAAVAVMDSVNCNPLNAMV